jgi:hypothetical protein
MGFGDAADQTVEAQAAKVVGHSARGIGGWVEAQQLSQVLSQLPMAKAVEMRAEHDQSGEQRLHAPIVEAQGGSPLTVTFNWLHDLLVGSLANEAVVSDGLDVQETSIGSKADLPKRGQVLQSFADSEVTGCDSSKRDPHA